MRPFIPRVALMLAMMLACTYDFDRFDVSEGGASSATGGTLATGGSMQGGAPGPGGAAPGGGGSAGGNGGAGGAGGSAGGIVGGAGGEGGAGVVEALVLGDHPSGQEADKFVLTPALTSAELYAFELSPTGSVDVTAIKFELKSISGIATADVSARLFQDAGTIGALDAADTQIGVGAVDITNASGTVTFDLDAAPMSIVQDQPMLLVADVASLGMADAMAIALTPSSITARATSDQAAIVTTGSATDALHQVLLADVPVGDVLLYYGQGSVATPFTRLYDDATSAWSTPDAAASAGSTIKWIAAPEALTDREIVGVLSDNGTTTKLSILRRGATTWNVNWASTAIASSQSRRRGFDVEREAMSGDTLVVYSDNTNKPVYRVLSGNTWSAEASVAGAPGAGIVQWVELVRRPGTDEIALVYQDSDSDIVTVTWDGSAWGAKTILEGANNTSETLAFGAAYESVSGDLVVVWGHVVGDPAGFYWARRAAGSTSFTFSGVGAAPLNRPGVVRMAAEPGTDRIALAYLELTNGGTGNDDFIAAIWDGATNAWTAKTSLDASIGANYASFAGAIPIDVAWLGTSGTAVAVYSDAGNNAIDWAKFNGTAWQIQTDFNPTPSIQQRVNVQAVSFPGQTKAMFLVGDSNNDLFAKIYNGTAWSDAGGALETNVSSTNSMPFTAVMKE